MKPEPAGKQTRITPEEMAALEAGGGMLPEHGDRCIRVTREDVAAAAKAVGIVPGDVVMFHSSMSSMGTVVGGADAVIDGFLDAVGPAGTVAVPTLCNWKPEEQHLVFNRWNSGTSPSVSGLISETLRQRPDAVRSDHATHSVAAIGARAAELTASHGRGAPRRGPYGEKAFSQESPWERLSGWNAAYCFIGVTFRVCTMVHYVEALIAERALRRAAPEARARLTQALAGWMTPGVWPDIRIDDRVIIEQMLAEQGIVRYGKIGSATLRCARARPMVAQWLAIVERDPNRWLPKEFLDWLGRGRPS